MKINSGEFLEVRIRLAFQVEMMCPEIVQTSEVQSLSWSGTLDDSGDYKEDKVISGADSLTM